MRLEVILIILSLSILYPGALVIEAHAYLDAGTGSVVIQALIGVLVGVGISLKIYWYKIKEKFTNEILGSNKKFILISTNKLI